MTESLPVVEVSQHVPPLRAQTISVEVLIEKYAKGDERSIEDVSRRVAEALAQHESIEHRAHWQQQFLHALQGFAPVHVAA